MSTDFIARWSRRKRGADPSSALPTPPEDASPDLSAGIDGEAAEAGLPAEIAWQGEGDSILAPLSADELADLPSPEELTAASDITGFLRSGVPAALRNRALRRMWSIDPAIRDAIGDARDYAWDWNVPGGMPVSGPIPASIDIDKMVRGIFGTEKSEEVEPETDPVPAEIPGPCPVPAEIPVAEGPDGSEPSSATAEMRAEAAPLAPEHPAETPLASAQARPLRHGGALPG
ncbi:hypothetical protein Sa4125_16800 [Aureimonas sp. SA4125]|uniref:DUF3306 domain-containing protein n=1 Tax=Aureimonas sp. SA4125 TaxID=2826993 RepID=UPI001CC69869|nr:DUF3306 domain-containing protein [Aureimonas sp. SA4125]BDA84138.1 hypothetical protein Sa4125_16800 [Aureimonas sp. SA4125]